MIQTIIHKFCIGFTEFELTFSDLNIDSFANHKPLQFSRILNLRSCKFLFFPNYFIGNNSFSKIIVHSNLSLTSSYSYTELSSCLVVKNEVRSTIRLRLKKFLILAKIRGSINNGLGFFLASRWVVQVHPAEINSRRLRFFLQNIFQNLLFCQVFSKSVRSGATTSDFVLNNKSINVCYTSWSQ